MRILRLRKDFLRRFKWRITGIIALVMLAILIISMFIGYGRVFQVEGSYLSVYKGSLLAAYLDRERLEEGLQTPTTITIDDKLKVDAILLREALQHVNALPTQFETVLVRSVGQEPMELSGMEIWDSENIFIAYGKSKKALPSADGGPFALMIIDEDNSVSILSDISIITIVIQED